MRLRAMTDSATGARALKLTRKYEAADPLARPITTAYLTDAGFVLFAALPAHRLTKRRFELPSNGATFSVDLFEGPLAGLELAEIEAPDDASLRVVPSPQWSAREVSHVPSYQGATLAQSGIPQE